MICAFLVSADPQYSLWVLDLATGGISGLTPLCDVNPSVFKNALSSRVT